jgi:hypothetical protein
MTPKWETPQELDDMLEAIWDQSRQLHHDTQSDEKLLQCLVCGEWEGHTVVCPIPVIETWLDQPTSDIRDIDPKSPEPDSDGLHCENPGCGCYLHDGKCPEGCEQPQQEDK